jgi:MoaA/NifB/PqqE/SkfB family radical SAM enzyme
MSVAVPRGKNIFPSRRLFWPKGFVKTRLKFSGLLRSNKRPRLPVALTAYVTYRCNMRCRICGIWKGNAEAQSEELSLEEWNRLLSDPLFSKLEIVNINGGEPNLRQDLVPLVARFIERCPHLSALSLNSNGLPPEKTIVHAEQISRMCRDKNIRFSVSLSLHRIGAGFDDITGIKDSYPRVMQAFEGLKRLRREQRFYVSANCVISRLNLSSLDEMLLWSQKEIIPVNFVLGEVRDRFLNADMQDDVLVQGKDRIELILFLRKLARQPRLFGQHALRYRHLADMIEYGTPRTLSCHYFLGGAVVGSDGLLYFCKNSEPIGDLRTRPAHRLYFDETNLDYRIRGLQKNRCLRCPPYTMNSIEVAMDLFRVLSHFVAHR